jgi:hypothetical protein
MQIQFSETADQIYASTDGITRLFSLQNSTNTAEEEEKILVSCDITRS